MQDGNNIYRGEILFKTPMKKLFYKIFGLSLIVVSVIPGCEFFSDFQGDIPYSFHIQIDESETLVNAERNNSVNIQIFAESGLSKVELRQNFITVEGSINDYNGETEASYVFELRPGSDEIGESISYTIVAIDTEGFAVSKELRLVVREAPETVTILLPPTAPEKIRYMDSISFKVPFTSPTPLSFIKVTYGDSVLLEKTDGFLTPESDIIDFSYNEFNVLVEGENRDFYFDFIGVAPVDGEEHLFDTAIITYHVYVKGPRAPQPITAYDNLTMGFQGFDGANQFIDAETGSLYGYLLEPLGSDNSSLIDIAVYRSSSNGLCLTNPTDAPAAEFIYKDVIHGFSGWQTLNRTEFLRITDGSITVSDFESAINDEQFYNAFENADLLADTYKKLLADEIVVFKTVSDKYGAILFHSYENSSSGSVIVSLKVQQ